MAQIYNKTNNYIFIFFRMEKFFESLADAVVMAEGVVRQDPDVSIHPLTTMPQGRANR
jgi:hypothetical protein